MQVRQLHSQGSAWGRALRLPNLLTAPGDPLAGFLLAGGTDWRAALAAAGAGLLLYACGLLLNDWADAPLDAVDRPERPIPSGGLSRRRVLAAAIACAATGTALAFGAGVPCGLAAIAVLALIAVYDLGTGLPRMARVMTMGLCRGGSLLMGAAAGGAVCPPAVWIGFGTTAGYIAALSLVAAGETAEQRPGWLAMLPGAWVAGGLAALLPAAGSPWVIAAAAVAAGNALAIGGRIARHAPPAAAQRTIGQWIRNLLPMQAAFCAAGGGRGGLWAAAGLLGLWPVACRLGRRFAGS